MHFRWVLQKLIFSCLFIYIYIYLCTHTHTPKLQIYIKNMLEWVKVTHWIRGGWAVLEKANRFNTPSFIFLYICVYIYVSIYMYLQLSLSLSMNCSSVCVGVLLGAKEERMRVNYNLYIHFTLLGAKEKCIRRYI